MNHTKNKSNNSLIPFYCVIILFALLSLLNLPIIETLWRHGFDDGTYSHAFLIPFIVIYLFFQLAKNGKLHLRKKLSAISIALLVLSGILLFVTSNAQISLGYWFAILALAISSLIVLFNFSWITLFPAAFLIFIFPFWGLLTPFLQDLSVVAVSYIMTFTGIPTYVNAEFITIPAGVFEIAGGCSGLRYFIVSLAISSLFIFLHIKSLKRAMLFFSVAIIGALLTNWIRITALIVIGEYTNMESSLMEDHNAFGWYIYLPFMVLLFKWGNTLVDTDIFENTSEVTPKSKPLPTVLVTLTAVLILSSTTIKAFLINNESIQTSENIDVSTISPTVFFYSNIVYKSLNDEKNTYQIYTFDGSDLDGKPSYYGNDMIPQGYRLIKSDTMNNWNMSYIRSPKNRAVILFRYELDNKTYTNLSAFKIARLKNALKNNTKTQLHWIYLNCKYDCESTVDAFFTLSAKG